MQITRTRFLSPLLGALFSLLGCQLELDDGLVEDDPCPEGYTCTPDQKPSSDAGRGGYSDAGANPDTDWGEEEDKVPTPTTTSGYADGGFFYTDGGKGYYDGGYADGGRGYSDAGDDWDDPEPGYYDGGYYDGGYYDGGYYDGGYSDGGRWYDDWDSGWSDGGIVRPEGGNWFLPDGAITVEDGGGTFCDSGYFQLPDAGDAQLTFDHDADTVSWADGSITYWHDECGWFFRDSGTPPPPGVGQACVYDSNCLDGQYCGIDGVCILR